MQYRDTQDLYLKVRVEEVSKCSDTQDLYLRSKGRWEHSVQTLRTSIKVRGKVGDSEQTLRTCIERSEGRWEQSTSN